MTTLVDDNQIEYELLKSTDAPPLENVIGGTDITLTIEEDGTATITYTGGA